MMMISKLKFEVFGKKRDVDISTEPGDKMKQTYRTKIDVDGKKKLVEDELIDLDEMIQSNEESVNINNIMNRYLAGDDSALDRAKAFYADVSRIPKNLAQMLELNNNAKQVFNGLPPEVRQLFGNSYWEFLNNPQVLDDWIANNNPSIGKEVIENVVEQDIEKDSE